MVAVSFGHEFIFLKTRKTAGTSVEMALEVLCRPPHSEIREETDAIMTEAGIVGRRLRPRPHGQNGVDWFSHMPAQRIKDALGAERYNHFQKVTTIRNPFDLAISRFHWQLGRRGIPEASDNRETKAQFSAMLSEQHPDYCQTALHIDGVFQPTNVIRFETLQADLTDLCREIAPGIAINIPHTKKTSSRRRMPVPDYFDRKTTDIILKAADWIFDRFDYPRHPIDAD